MLWTVEALNAVVDAEIEALPKDMRAKLVRLSILIEQSGLQALPRDSVKLGGQTVGASHHRTGRHFARLAIWSLKARPSLRVTRNQSCMLTVDS